MPEGLAGGATRICDDIARQQVAEVRHELRNYQSVNDIKAQNLKTDLERTASEVKTELTRTAQELKSNQAASAATVKADFEAKHGEVTTAISKIESLLKWAGSLIITLILGVLGWSLLQQITNNQQQQKDLQSQIKLLEQQERARQLQLPEARMLPPSAAETALTTNGVSQ
jgi:hypothetical protein